MKSWLSFSSLCLLAGGSAFGQAPDPAPCIGCQSAELISSAAEPTNCWGSADYLLWRFSKGPLSTPLVTTGDPLVALPGAIGQPGTVALLGGGSGLDYGRTSGARLSLGGWLDSERSIGVEGSGFLFEQRATHFAVASSSAGNPPIYLPVVDQDPASLNFGHPSIYTVADPLFPGAGPTSGHVTVDSSMRLWGAEVNGLVNFSRTDCWTVDGIVGLRYLDLRENLRIAGFTNDQFDDLQQSFNDTFSTRNQFYGGQVGARFGFRSDGVSLDVTGKLAVGSTSQLVDIQGSSIYSGTGFAPPPGVYPGGVYTQPSSISRATANNFTVVPQLGIKLGLDLTDWLTANIGYDLFYWSSVVRPGSQVDHNLNPTQFPGAGFNGLPLPAPQFNRTDFLGNGVSFGLTVHY